MFEHIYAAKHSVDNRDALKNSDLCGCYRCGAIFEPSEIDQWVHEDENGVEVTATCPRCSIDSILPESAGFLLTNDLMTKMHNYWFELVHHYTPEELVEDSTIKVLNKYYLRPKGFRVDVVKDETDDRKYLFLEGKQEFYNTKNPKEMLIKVGQLLPDSDVEIETEETILDGKNILREKMIIHLHQQIPD